MLPYVHPSPATLVLVLLFEQTKYVAPQDRCHVVLSTGNASSLSLSWMLLTPFSLCSNVSSSERASMTTYLKWHPILQSLSFLLYLFLLCTISGTCILHSGVYLFVNCLSPELMLTKMGNFIALVTFLPSVSPISSWHTLYAQLISFK